MTTDSKPGAQVGQSWFASCRMTTFIRTLAFLFLLAAGLPAQHAERKPNFSGTWRMDAEKSDFGKFPAPTTILRTIAQKDPDLVVDTTQRAANGEQTAHVVYRTDGAETKNQLSTGEGASHAFWDGNDLVIRTTMTNSKGVDVLMEERWSLSPDGQTLTTLSHIETSKGGADLKLVCHRVKPQQP
jgi:hypothetical protein